jgi:ABC-type glutathione transport system ATPase component
VRNADLIVVCDAGRVVEQGTHDQLLQRPDGAYSLLVKAQQQPPHPSAASPPEQQPGSPAKASPALTRQASQQLSSANRLPSDVALFRRESSNAFHVMARFPRCRPARALMRLTPPAACALSGVRLAEFAQV